MTYKDLTEAVAELGFESEVNDEGALRHAISRALYVVHTDRPSERIAEIARPGRRARLIFAHLEHTPGVCECYQLEGRAYSFTVSGRGEYTVTTDSYSFTERFDSALLPVRGFIPGKGEIRFGGDYAFTVLALASFPTVRSDRAEDIPLYRDYGRIILSEAIPDLLAISGEVTDAGGGKIKGARISAGALELPESYSGRVLVSYYRTPTLPSGIDPDEKIDVPAECEQLLPLLVASYVWLEDSPDKAQYYLSLYRDGISTLRSFISRKGVSEYRTDGWA